MANTAHVWTLLAAPCALGSLVACGPHDWESADYGSGSPAPNVQGDFTLFGGKVERANAKVAPISGGTLLVAKDGHAVASDPDRDQVHVVDLAALKTRTIQLEEGDEPGRVVDGPAGSAYVTTRRGGAIIAVDLAAATATRIPVCSAPRGLAYDDVHSQLFVACRSGVLAVIDTKRNEVAQRFRLDPDLRDVVLSGDNLAVTRFKSAEVLVVSRQGELLRRAKPQLDSVAFSGSTPSVAYRAMAAPGGGVLVGHVDATNRQLASGAGTYYGAPCGGAVTDLAVSVIDTDTVQPAPIGVNAPEAEPKVTTRFSQALGGMAGPLDLAVSPDGNRLAFLATGNSWVLPEAIGAEPPTLYLARTDEVTRGVGVNVCPNGGQTIESVRTEGEAVAVAFDREGQWVVQSREPAQLLLQNGKSVSLALDRRFDTGVAMFHMNTGGGVACTSCHPEAGEDGHTWNFSVGLRRSQSLEGGVNSRAPFHWSGDLATFDALFDEVMIKRMSLRAGVNAEQRGALRDWLDSVPAQVPAADDLDAESVQRGAALFSDAKVACSTCHSGSDYSDHRLHDVGTGLALITPSLRGVAMRAPLFHDGCAVSLTARFGPCSGGDKHGATSHLTAAERSDLVAFMQSL